MKKMNRKSVIMLVILAAFLAIPLVDSNQYHIYMLDRALLNAMIASGLVALTGLAGQMSLGHAAFYGIGAYASAIVTKTFGVPVIVGVISAAVLCLVIGMLLSIPSFKLSGFYLSFVTISFGNIVWTVIVNWYSLTGGSLGLLGIQPIRIAGRAITRTEFFYLAAAVLALIYFVTTRMARSYIGRGLRAVRDDEMAAETAGIDTKRLKLLVFSLSAIYAGIAGALYAHLSTFLSPESFVQAESANFVAMSVVGGIRHMLGGTIGGLVVTMIPEFLRVKGWEIYYLMGSSLAILVLVIMLPNGLAPSFEKFIDRLAGIDRKNGKRQVK
ncbi:MAG TPA: branched-chain amino acid ABC transporter permease [Bacillota bacterium]|nr:branched-chain amino acid ABC transporter permease [Bacillota bacterium]